MKHRIIKATQKELRDIAASWISDNERLIVEIGCNDGNFAKLIKGYNYIGLDIQKNKIIEAKRKLPKHIFCCTDITENLFFLGKASMIVSFQCLEHIKDDLKVIEYIKSGTRIILSVPNSKYKGHIRWYELDGWMKRYKPFIEFDQAVTIQNINKKNKRSFLLKGIRRK